MSGHTPVVGEFVQVPHQGHNDLVPLNPDQVFDSALMYSYNDAALHIDFSAIGGVIAVGGEFGNILSSIHDEETPGDDGGLGIYGPDGAWPYGLLSGEGNLVEGNMHQDGDKATKHL